MNETTSACGKDGTRSLRCSAAYQQRQLSRGLALSRTMSGAYKPVSFSLISHNRSAAASSAAQGLGCRSRQSRK